MRAGEPSDVAVQRRIVGPLAATAVQLAAAVDSLVRLAGVTRVERQQTRLAVEYDLERCTLSDVETAITATGAGLPSTPAALVVRALARLEDAVAAAGTDSVEGWDALVRAAHASVYRRRRHGRRDDRPQQWRRYLERGSR